MKDTIEELEPQDHPPKTRRQTGNPPLTPTISYALIIRSADEETPKMPETIICIEPGVYVIVGPSATGQGSHVRWIYNNLPALGSQKGANEDQEKPPTHDPLYCSVFGGSHSSLSSLSSWGSIDRSSESSFSVVETSDSLSYASAPESPDTSYELIASSSSMQGGTPEPTPQTPTRSRGKLVVFAAAKEDLIASPRTLVKNKRPLLRSTGQRWTHDSGGNLVPTGISYALAKAVALPIQQRKGGIDFNEIFSSEFQKLKSQREQITVAFQNWDEEDADMVNDAAQIHGAPHASTAKGGKSMGPHGTQLIDDDDFNPAPVDMGVYRQEWIECQSTALRPFPTDLPE